MISLKNIFKTFPQKNGAVQALQNINLEIKKGQFIAVFGPSGSGKSTLLNLIGGLEKPSKGSVKVNGNELSRLSPLKLAHFRSQKVGFVFQDFLLLPWLTVEENISLPGKLSSKLGMARASAKSSQLETLLKAVDLKKRRYHKPPLISGGEKQRTVIARALFNQPHILLADEPTGNLDEKTAAQILKLFQKIHKKDKLTIVIATHDRQIAAIADRIINLHEGKICSL